MLAVTVIVAYVCSVGAAVARVDGQPRTVTEPAEVVLAGKGLRQRTRPVSPAHLSGSVTVPLYRGHSEAYYVWQLRVVRRQLHLARVFARRRWHPTVDYAFRLASAVSGVSYWQLRSVAWCESTHNPFAQNGRYKGLFQLGWSPFGFSPYDPIANALSAALTVKHDKSWRQWECKP